MAAQSSSSSAVDSIYQAYDKLHKLEGKASEVLFELPFAFFRVVLLCFLFVFTLECSSLIFAFFHFLLFDSFCAFVQDAASYKVILDAAHSAFTEAKKLAANFLPCFIPHFPLVRVRFRIFLIFFRQHRYTSFARSSHFRKTRLMLSLICAKMMMLVFESLPSRVSFKFVVLWSSSLVVFLMLLNFWALSLDLSYKLSNSPLQMCWLSISLVSFSSFLSTSPLRLVQPIFLPSSASFNALLQQIRTTDDQLRDKVVEFFSEHALALMGEIQRDRDRELALATDVLKVRLRWLSLIFSCVDSTVIFAVCAAAETAWNCWRWSQF